MDGEIVEDIMKQRGKTHIWGLLCGRVNRELLVGTLAILLVSESAWAALDKGITEHTLDNGLTVIVVEDH